MDKHWHLAVGELHSAPAVNVILDPQADVTIQFLDFCQSFFYRDFEDSSRTVIEAKMSEFVNNPDEEKAFQMTGTGYAALCYPCHNDCKMESLN
jgi:hypothetical protein